MELTLTQVQAITGATRANAKLYLPFLQGTCKAYEINTPRRVVGFLSQVGHESKGLSTVVESLNYSVEGLLETFLRHRIGEQDARRLGRAPGRKANQEAIANLVYGGKFGRDKLGNTEPGDGWMFIGRGLKQLTGRDNYNRCGLALGEDFVNQPERLEIPVNAALSAGWFWSVNHLNALADIGDVPTMTRIVNGGSNGLGKRIALWRAGLQVFA